MKTLVLIRNLFAGTGILCLLAAGYSAYSVTRFLSSAEQTEGTIIGFGGSEGNFPVFTYQDHTGQPHRKTSNTSSDLSSYRVGGTIPLLLDRNDPGNAQIQGFAYQWMSPLFFAIFGLTFGGVGFGMIFHSNTKGKRKRQLLERGDKVKARITGVELNGSLTVNGRSPFRIEAQSLIDGKVHLFHSENLWFDPTAFVNREEVDVYHMTGRYKPYHMDISFLPEQAA